MANPDLLAAAIKYCGLIPPEAIEMESPLGRRNRVFFKADKSDKGFKATVCITCPYFLYLLKIRDKIPIDTTGFNDLNK